MGLTHDLLDNGMAMGTEPDDEDIDKFEWPNDWRLVLIAVLAVTLIVAWSFNNGGYNFPATTML